MADVIYKRGQLANLNTNTVPVEDGQVIIGYELDNERGEMYVDIGTKRCKISSNVDEDSIEEALSVKPGEKTLEGGEIFNDYENNNAYGKHASALGTHSIAGSKAFTILAVDKDNLTYTLDSTEGLEVGDVYSVHLLYGVDTDGNTKSQQGENYGSITAINDNIVTVDKLFYPVPEGYEFTILDSYIDDNGFDKELNTFRIIEKPEVGTRIIGHGCIAGGVNNRSLSKGAISFGSDNLSQGSYAVTFGSKNKAGYASIAVGAENNVSGYAAFAAGEGNKSTQLNSIAMGRKCEANHPGSVALGIKSITSADAQIVVGKWNTPQNDAIFIVGNGTNSKTSNALYVNRNGQAVLGNTSILNVDSAVTTKKYVDDKSSNTIATSKDYIDKTINSLNIEVGTNPTALVFNADKNTDTSSEDYHNATAPYATVFGKKNEASGTEAFAIGVVNKAKGSRSFTAGHGNIANGYAQTIVGLFNEETDKTTYQGAAKELFIVGNGVSDTTRSNAFVVYKDGHAEVQTMGATNNSVATKEYVDNKSNKKVFMDIDPKDSGQWDKFNSTWVLNYEEKEDPNDMSMPIINSATCLVDADILNYSMFQVDMQYDGFLYYSSHIFAQNSTDGCLFSDAYNEYTVLNGGSMYGSNTGFHSIYISYPISDGEPVIVDGKIELTLVHKYGKLNNAYISWIKSPSMDTPFRIIGLM